MLSVETLDGILKLTTYVMMKIVATVVAVTFVVEILLVSFKNLSITTSMN